MDRQYVPENQADPCEDGHEEVDGENRGVHAIPGSIHYTKENNCQWENQVVKPFF